MQIYSKSMKNATSLSFLGRFWFRLFYLIGLVRASKLLHRILKFINYANLCTFIQNQWKMPPLLYSEITTDLHLRRGHITHRVIYYPLVYNNLHFQPWQRIKGSIKGHIEHMNNSNDINGFFCAEIFAWI